MSTVRPEVEVALAKEVRVDGFAVLSFDNYAARREANTSPQIQKCNRDSEEFVGAVSRVVTESTVVMAPPADAGVAKAYVLNYGAGGHDAAWAEAVEAQALATPGVCGYTRHKVLEQAGAPGSKVPVLFLTARDSIDDRVKGLELGADDYLVKPFAFAELLARVRTLLRRGALPSTETTLSVADLEVDLMRRRVLRAGRRIPLSAKEFALLELLLRHHDEVLPRSLIASQVWDMNFDSDTNVIDVAIRRLRAKIDDAFEPKLIHTVRGMGYMLDAASEA